jgi:hypothetical protein
MRMCVGALPKKGAMRASYCAGLGVFGQRLSHTQRVYDRQAFFPGLGAVNHSNEICCCAESDLTGHFRYKCVANGVFRTKGNLGAGQEFPFVVPQNVPVVILAGFLFAPEFRLKLFPNLIRIERGHFYFAEGSSSIRNRSRSELMAGEREASL